jgi:putative intracellular protease/amidase
VRPYDRAVPAAAEQALTRCRRLLRRRRHRETHSQPIVDAQSLSARDEDRPALRVAVLAHQGVAVGELVAVTAGLATGFSTTVRVAGRARRFVGIEPVRTVVVDRVVDADPESFEPCEVVVLPGGMGWRSVADDPLAVDWVRRVADHAQGVLAVSTGSLIAAAAGLLTDEPATGHWLAASELARLGAVPVNDRVVDASGVVTASGVRSAFEAGQVLADRLRWAPDPRVAR